MEHYNKNCIGSEVKDNSLHRLASIRVKSKSIKRRKNKLTKGKHNYAVNYRGDIIINTHSHGLADGLVAVHTATDAINNADTILLKEDLEITGRGKQYKQGFFVNINNNIKRALVGNLGNLISLTAFYIAFTSDIPLLAVQLLLGSIIQHIINGSVIR